MNYFYNNTSLKGDGANIGEDVDILLDDNLNIVIKQEVQRLERNTKSIFFKIIFILLILIFAIIFILQKIEFESKKEDPIDGVSTIYVDSNSKLPSTQDDLFILLDKYSNTKIKFKNKSAFIEVSLYHMDKENSNEYVIEYSNIYDCVVIKKKTIAENGDVTLEKEPVKIFYFIDYTTEKELAQGIMEKLEDIRTGTKENSDLNVTVNDDGTINLELNNNK